MKHVIFYPAFALLALAGCATSTVTVHDQSSGNVTYPDGRIRRVITMVPPEYPEALRTAGVAGIVVVQFWIARDGTVSSAKIVYSARTELSALAMDAIRKWRFEPEPSDPKEYLVAQLPLTFDVSKRH